jgi:FkbM family methyltransferase
MLAIIRRLAQTIRHAPGMRSFTPLWNLLRAPYLKVLRTFAKKHGLLVSVGGHKMRLHPDFATQNWETVEYDSYQSFAALLRPGNVVFDVGAHIGTYTLIALQKVGDNGRVVAYEPHTFTRKYLEQHLDWNGGLKRTIVRDLCCGVSEGMTDFYCRSDRAEGMNSLVPTDGFEKKSVMMTTLDKDVETLAIIPTLIKIDVEGSEWDVLKGALRTISKYHPTIFLSLHPVALSKLGVSPNQVLEWLVEHGYRHKMISQDHEIHVVASKDQAELGAWNGTVA